MTLVQVPARTVIRSNGMVKVMEDTVGLLSGPMAVLQILMAAISIVVSTLSTMVTLRHSHSHNLKHRLHSYSCHLGANSYKSPVAIKTQTR